MLRFKKIKNNQRKILINYSKMIIKTRKNKIRKNKIIENNLEVQEESRKKLNYSLVKKSKIINKHQISRKRKLFV